MNLGAKLITLAVIACALVVLAIAAVTLFRFSCLIAGVPRPGLGRSVGMVLVSFVAVNIVEGVLGAAVWGIYQTAGFPLWEAGLVAFFVGLPVHMIVCAAIHAKMSDLTLADGISVWFVEKLIQAILILASIGMLLLVIAPR